MALLTTFFWNTSSFSGSAQLNEGPFFVGFVNKFFKVEVHGMINFQGAVFGSSSVEANFAAFGLQQVPHGAAALDVITSTDNETWFMRRQIGQDDHRAVWAPDTSNSALLASQVVTDRWAGQLAIGADTDLFLSVKTSTGAALGNLNSFGTIRLWWG